MLRKILLATAALMIAAPLHAEDIHIKVWTLKEGSTPYREQNIVDAAKILNTQFKAAGVDKKVIVDAVPGAQKGWDDLALDTMKAFAVDQGPDIYLLPHEWIGKFAEAGYAMNMEASIKANPWVYNDILPNLWTSAKAADGHIYGVPQDAEIRMFFYNKDMLRKLGKSEEFIANLPAEVEKGAFTIDDWSALAKEVKDAGIAEYGMLHRPNVGIDYLMTFNAFGVKYVDEKTGKLILTKKEMTKALAWFEKNAKEGVTPSDNTSMSWNAIKTAFKTEKAFIFHQGIWAVAWQVGDKFGSTWPTDGKGYFHKIGWIPVPAAEKGGVPANISHPIIYSVNPKGTNPEIAQQLVAIASLPYYNVRHALASFHTAISNAEAGLPAYKENWALSEASKLMNHTSFVPNNTHFADYNRVLFNGLQAVETGRMTADEAVEFIVDELDMQLGDAVEIRESAE